MPLSNAQRKLIYDLIDNGKTSSIIFIFDELMGRITELKALLGDMSEEKIYI